jgi:hypothetical protein
MVPVQNSNGSAAAAHAGNTYADPVAFQTQGSTLQFHNKPVVGDLVVPSAAVDFAHENVVRYDSRDAIALIDKGSFSPKPDIAGSIVNSCLSSTDNLHTTSGTLVFAKDDTGVGLYGSGALVKGGLQ